MLSIISPLRLVLGACWFCLGNQSKQQAKFVVGVSTWALLSSPMDYHLVSVPASGNRQNTSQNLKGKLAEVASTYLFPIPEFKVGYILTCKRCLNEIAQRSAINRLVHLTPLFSCLMNWWNTIMFLSNQSTKLSTSCAACSEINRTKLLTTSKWTIVSFRFI